MRAQPRGFGATDFAAKMTRWLAETKLAEGERTLVPEVGIERTGGVNPTGS